MASKKQSLPLMVADDNGYADHKLAWFDENGDIMTLKVPAIIQLGGQGLSSGTGKQVGAYKYKEYDYHCSVGVTDPLKIRTPDYPTTIANRVLMVHSLTKAGKLGLPVELAVTLPFREMFNQDGTINTKLREATASNFVQNDVLVLGSEAQPNVVKSVVYAEALSAWFDWAIKADGSMADGYTDMVDMQGQMLVVDIGGSTTDLACVQIIEDEMLILHQKSGTEKMGVLDAKAAFTELMRVSMEKDGLTFAGNESVLPATFVNTLFEKGRGTWQSKNWDLTRERDQACRGIAERISSYIKSRAGDPNMFYAILVVGGGAIVFADMLKQLLPNAIFSDEFANARGALKVLRDKRNETADA
jgi:plasmid segregation protein ParM